MLVLDDTDRLISQNLYYSTKAKYGIVSTWRWTVKTYIIKLHCFLRSSSLPLRIEQNGLSNNNQKRSTWNVNLWPRARSCCARAWSCINSSRGNAWFLLKYFFSPFPDIPVNQTGQIIYMLKIFNFMKETIKRALVGGIKACTDDVY